MSTHALANGSSIVGVTAPYWEFASQFGEVIPINPLTKEVNKDLDLLILVGGADVNPATYAQAPSIRTNKSNQFLEYFDREVLPQYLDLAEDDKLTIVGTCRGFQVLNVAYGGTLVQHHVTPLSSPRNKLVETVVDRHQKEMFKVNSLHHQSVFDDDLSDELVPLAWSAEFGNIEIFKHKTASILGFQYHQEELIGHPSELFLKGYLAKLWNLE